MRARSQLLFLLLSAMGPSLGAQQRPDSARADTARTLRPVDVTETRAATTVGGASAVVVKPGELRSSPAPVLEQALRESPFVHVRQNSRGEMELSVRGSDSRQAAVIIDGVPVTVGWDHRIDPSLVPLTGAQNLVIIRGLASLLQGPNVLGGSVEVSHDDVFGRLDGGRLWGGIGIDENSAWVASVGGGRDFGERGDGVSLRAGVAHRDREGFSLASGVADLSARDGLRTNSDLVETDGFVSARWQGESGRSAGVLVSGFTAERGVPPEEHLAGPRLWRYPYNERVLATLSGSAGSFATPFGFATLDLGGGINAGRSRIDIFSDRTYSSITGTELGDERTLTGRAGLSHSLPGDARIRMASTAAQVDYTETLQGVAADYRQRLFSAGAEVDLPLRSGTDVSGGFVYDRTTSPLTGGRTPGQPPLDNVGWRVGVTHVLNADARLHAGVSERSRFPSLRELYSGALDRFEPNPSLRPETLLGIESGVTIDKPIGRASDARLQLNLFRHDLRDAIVRITLPPPDRRFRRINRDRIRSHGAEMLAGVAYGAIPERAFTLTGDAMIQRISIEDRVAGGARHAENNPETRGMLELGAPLPLKWRGYVNTRYSGRQYCLNSDTGAEIELRSATVTNAGAERRLRASTAGAVRNVRILAALDNLANAAVYDQCGLPQPGRTLRLMLTFN